jgi:hypothetical protein
MDTASESNERRLRDVELIAPDAGELPQEYAALVDSLTSDEVDVLVAVTKRLKEAERVSGKGRGDVFLAP